MAMNDSVKRKEPEPETEKVEKKVEEKAVAEADTKPDAETPKIVVAVKSASTSEEPEAKRLKPTPPDSGVVRKQIEYYLSDDNLKFDKFFHEKISANEEGWLEVALVLSCNKMKALRATTRCDDSLEGLQD